MNKYLSREELLEILADRVNHLMNINNLEDTVVARAAVGEDEKAIASLVTTIGYVKRKKGFPSLYNFYLLHMAIPGLDFNSIAKMKRKYYAEVDGPAVVEEPMTKYETIRPWAEEKIALLEKISTISDDLRTCYQENIALKQKLSDTEKKLSEYK